MTNNNSNNVVTGQGNLIKGRIAAVHELFNLLQPENVSFKRFRH